MLERTHSARLNGEKKQKKMVSALAFTGGTRAQHKSE